MDGGITELIDTLSAHYQSEKLKEATAVELRVHLRTREMTTVRDLLAEARGRLVAAGLDAHDARVDADVLVREAFGWDRARLLAHTGDAATAGVTARLAALVRGGPRGSRCRRFSAGASSGASSSR